MRVRREIQNLDAGRPGADQMGGLRRWRAHKGALSATWLLLSLVVLLPAFRHHGGYSDACQLEQSPEPAASRLFLPERLTLGTGETSHVSFACPSASPVGMIGASVPAIVVLVTPALSPLARGTSPFPLRV